MKVYVEVPVLTEAQRELFYLKEGSVNAPSQPAHERGEIQAAIPQMHIVDGSSLLILVFRAFNLFSVYAEGRRRAGT